MTKIQNYIFSASRWLVLFSVLGLILRRGLFKPYTLQPFEIIIILASILFLFIVFKKKLFSHIGPVWIWFLGVIALLLLLGFVNSFFIFGIDSSILAPSSKDFFLLTTVFLGFYLTAIYGEDPTFRKRIFYFLSGAILFTPFIFFPQHAFTAGVMTDGFQFIGWQNNPTIFGLFVLIPFIICVEQTFRQKRWLAKTPYWIGAILLYSLILWSSSRGIWFASILAVGFLSFYYIFKIYLPHSLLRNISTVAVLLFFSFLSSFLILSSPVKIMVLDRVFPIISNYTARPEIFKELSLNESFIIMRSKEKNLPEVPYQNRKLIFSQALGLLVKHPYGIGPEYFRIIPHSIFDGEKGPTTAHNTFLQAGLSGGFLLIIVYVLLWIKIWQTLMRTQRDQEWLWLSASLLGIFFVSMLGDFLFYVPAIWILMGLVVAKGKTPPMDKIAS